MDASSMKKGSKIERRLFFNLIILAAIIFGLSIISCSTPRSIRSGKKSNKAAPVETKKSERDLSEFTEDDFTETREIIAQNSENGESDENGIAISPEDYLNADGGLAAKPTKKIPTLREQLQAVQDEQVLVNYKISDLQEDVSDIKETLEYIKDEIKQINNSPKTDAVAGEIMGGGDIENSNDYVGSSIIDSESDSDIEENIILPDNEAKLKNISKSSTPKPKAKKSVKAVSNEKSESKNTVPPTKASAIKKTPAKTKIAEDNADAIIDDSGEDSPNKSMFNNAMKLFTERNYHKAIAELSNIIRTDKSPSMSSKCNYWLGESHFGLNQYDKAISYFDKVLKSGSASKKDDAMIMIAEAQVRSGKINEAKKMFNNFITVYPQSQFVPRAKKMLQQL